MRQSLPYFASPVVSETLTTDTNKPLKKWIPAVAGMTVEGLRGL